MVATVNHTDEGIVKDLAEVDLSASFLWFQTNGRRELTISF
jgi:hypothetical protein